MKKRKKGSSSSSNEEREEIFEDVSVLNKEELNLSPEKLTDLGTYSKLMGDIQTAFIRYQQALQKDPTFSPAHYNLGIIYSEQGRYQEGLLEYQAALNFSPHYVEAYCNIGVILKNLGKLEEGISYYQKALKINPNFQIAKNNLAIALTDLGTTLKNQGKIKEGISKYKEALEYNFTYSDAYYNLGVAYGAKHKYSQAITHYQLAIHFNPLSFHAYNNLGVIMKDRHNLESAIECYKAALNINPTFSQTLNNLGVVYTLMGNMEEAFQSINASIQFNPEYIDAYNNLGVLYRDEGNIIKSISCFDKCLEINPHFVIASQNKLLALNYLPDISLQELYKFHEEWGRNFLKQFSNISLPSYLLDLKDPQPQPIRIGYISPDFVTHSVSYFIESLLTQHNKLEFFIVCYSNILVEDSKTVRLKQHSSLWRDISLLNSEEAANLIIKDKIHILVELAGHTSGNRLDIMALKPAPIQISYLGYPNTTGLSTIDYRITDIIADPLNTEQQYSEKLIRLSKCFLCYFPPLESGPPVELPYDKNGYITFGSFNNLAKVNEKLIKIWSEIMNLVPNSKLVIKCKPFQSASVQKRFRTMFNNMGICSSRICLLGLFPQLTDHLQAYKLMDFSLDTFPYAGTTTTCESLLMGVPVITLKGKIHAQNVSASILTAIGETSLIANTEEEYVQLAVSLSNDTAKLRQLRSSLRRTMCTSPLCNRFEFTQEIEQIYRSIWKNWITKEGAA